MCVLISSAAQPEVRVEAVVNIDIDLKEINQSRAEEISAFLRTKGYTSTDTVISTQQDIYIQTQYKRLFVTDFMSSKMYERLRLLSTYNSRVANYSRGDAIADLRKRIIPLTEELWYNENHPNKTTTVTNGRSSWLARLLVEQSTAEYTLIEVSITGVQVTVTHLLNCKYLPQRSCAGYIHVK